MATAATLSAPAPSAATRLRRAGLDAAYLFTGLLASMLAFTAWITAVTLSLALAVLVVGLPLMLGTFECFRALTDLDRRRAAIVLGTPIPSVYRPRGQGGVWNRLRAAARDPQSWKDTAYLGLFSVVGFVWGTIALVVWGVVLGSIFLPAWWWSLPENAEYAGLLTIDSWELSAAVSVCGLLCLPLALMLQRGLAASQVWVARLLLGPSLAARVEHLTETRAGAVSAASAELHRIERDLHDGAQARLVALAMDLGMAEERFDRDPEGARELVGEARQEAKRALAELRDLARGIHPAVLADRGLDAAISALAARSPVPVGVDVTTGRLPDPVESAAYFVVAEALTNAAKHAQAAEIGVRIARHRDLLIVEVIDDGVGGADPSKGSGLRGLADRVAAVDGHLTVTSPPGGPTVIRAELPCGS
jgi:signal transduction histidine kinase